MASATASGSASAAAVPDTHAPPSPAKVLDGDWNFECLAFFPDSQKLVAGFSNGTCAIYDVESAQETAHTPRGHTFVVLAAAVSRDGKLIASSSHDNTVRIWDGGTGALVRVLKGHTQSVLSVDFSADGRRVASSGWDRTVRVCNVGDGALAWGPYECRESELRVHAAWVRYSPDGRQLAASVDVIYVWDAETGERVRVIRQCVASLQWTPDGTRFVGGGEGEIVVVDAGSGESIRSFKTDGQRDWLRLFALSPSGTLVASAHAGGDGTVRVWEVETGKEVASFPHEKELNHVAWSPSGEFISVGCWEHKAYLWSAPKGSGGGESADEAGEKVSRQRRLRLSRGPTDTRTTPFWQQKSKKVTSCSRSVSANVSMTDSWYYPTIVV